jgi:hypothetical protein
MRASRAVVFVLIPTLVASWDITNEVKQRPFGGPSVSPSPAKPFVASPTVTIHPSSASHRGIRVVGSHRSEIGYDSYLGIPFAEPPVGHLRFTHPKANTYPDDTILAQQWSPACLQLPVPVEGIPDIGGQYGMSEDCLYLNVFTPQGKHEEPLPVMLWM